MRLASSLSEGPAATSVERAIMEFRSGRPVVIDGAEASALAFGVENLDDARSAELECVAGGHAHLVLPAARLRRLGLDRASPGLVALPVVDRERIEALALKAEARIDAPVRPAAAVDEEALELARLSLVLPAVILVPLAVGLEVDSSLIRVPGGAIRAYRRGRGLSLFLLRPGPGPAVGGPGSEVLGVRGGGGLLAPVGV